MSKTLLLLGGSRYLLPVIDAAHEMGVRVVTCDYLPDNIAHRYSDAYSNASIVDKSAVLSVAQSIHADGIMSFAADPGVLSAAYVAEKLDIPFQGSYEAVSILQNKDRFRKFLTEHDFNCPASFSFTTVSDALKASETLPYPAIVKPVDSAGSKGCSRIDRPEQLAEAVECALSFSKSQKCIIEQFLEKQGDSSDADGFSVDGVMKCISFTSQLFDQKSPNPYTPSGYTMPSSMPLDSQAILKSELQRLCDLLKLRSGAFNIETRVATDGKPYIMEISPRGGGNRLCEMLHYASGIDLIKASVQTALGINPTGVCEPEYNGYWYQLMLHSNKDGVYKNVVYAPGLKESYLVEEQLWIEPGDRVSAFTSANHAFGSVMLCFQSQNDLANFMANPTSIHVDLEH